MTSSLLGKEKKFNSFGEYEEHKMKIESDNT